MPKSKITQEQCKAAFEEVRELLEGGENYRLNIKDDQYTVAKIDGEVFKLIYKPLGPSNFMHCCEWMRDMLKSSLDVDEEDEDDEDDEDASEEDEIAAEEEDEEEEAPKPRKSNR